MWVFGFLVVGLSMYLEIFSEQIKLLVSISTTLAVLTPIVISKIDSIDIKILQADSKFIKETIKTTCAGWCAIAITPDGILWGTLISSIVFIVAADLMASPKESLISKIDSKNIWLASFGIFSSLVLFEWSLIDSLFLLGGILSSLAYLLLQMGYLRIDSQLYKQAYIAYQLCFLIGAVFMGDVAFAIPPVVGICSVLIISNVESIKLVFSALPDTYYHDLLVIHPEARGI